MSFVFVFYNFPVKQQIFGKKIQKPEILKNWLFSLNINYKSLYNLNISKHPLTSN